jgi:hypothetical protein
MCKKQEHEAIVRGEGSRCLRVSAPFPHPAYLLAFPAQRGVAQSGSAPALGAGGPRFESGRPDSEEVETPLGLG